MKYYLAIDIGASSGRHIVGWRENGEIRTEEVFRFPNGMKEENGRLIWDAEALFDNVKAGIGQAFKRYPKLQSLAIDTWGVDYVLMRGSEPILPCYAYRDLRTKAAADEVHEIIPFETLYRRSGIAFNAFNSVYQLYDDFKHKRLNGATDFLMMPEYLNYRLTGVKKHEFTNATTTGLVNVQSQTYDNEMTDKLGFPKKIFGKLYRAGTRVGALKPEIAEEVGGQTEVVLCASHDTASAVEGIPMEKNSPYISSGTWSLFGFKTPNAITDDNSRRAGYSNEGGVGYYRYQKNILGMWIVNRLRDELCPGKPFPQITEEARQSAFRGVVDVNDDAFLAPRSMKEAFDLKAENGKPQTAGDYSRCALQSLAFGYKKALEELQTNSGMRFGTLYIVGGGARNGLLNELTERACGVKVCALPIEATALGNLKQQMIGK